MWVLEQNQGIMSLLSTGKCDLQVTSDDGLSDIESVTHSIYTASKWQDV